MRQIYLDYNATTPVHEEVLDTLITCHREAFGNPSSVHQFGRRTRVLVDEARDQIAAVMGAPAASVVLCSGGTEANNTILKGVAATQRHRGHHIVTSRIEHPAILDTCAYLETQGIEVTYVPVNHQGVVELEAVREALTDDTILVSIMHGNNEIGTLQPIAEIAQLARERKILVHTDAVQTFGKLPLSVNELGVDFLSFSGHKLYAPKGIGGWYARSARTLQPLIHGGHQERGIRSGTENVANIAALGTACTVAMRDMMAETERLRALQQRLEHGILETISAARIQGQDTPRLPNTTNVSFAGAEGETLLMGLDLQGVAISTGSACSSGSLEPSHVLQAMDLPDSHAHGALRLSTGRLTTTDDIDHVLHILPEIVKHARASSA